MESVKAYFKNKVSSKYITGALCAVTIDGEIIYRDKFGYSDCGQNIPLQNDSIFRLASMTKPITAVAVMICKERGLLELDAPIENYIEGFSHRGVGKLENGELEFARESREITLRDILTHSSGLGSGDVGRHQLGKIAKPHTLFENVMAWNNRFLDFEVGSKAAYSGSVAFELAALAVERVAKKPYGQFLQDEIFSRLGMKDTCYSLSVEQASRLVEMPYPDNKGKIDKVELGLRGFGAYAEGYTGGSAGLFSTLDDYVNFACMLANKGEWKGERIISGASVEEISKAYISHWGLSVYVRQAKSEKQPLCVGSFGWSGAYGTHFWVEPQSKTVAVLMLNHANCGGSGSPFSAEFEKLVAKELSDGYHPKCD